MLCYSDYIVSQFSFVQVMGSSVQNIDEQKASQVLSYTGFGFVEQKASQVSILDLVIVIVSVRTMLVRFWSGLCYLLLIVKLNMFWSGICYLLIGLLQARRMDASRF
jgi:hypothetical protein